MPKLSMFQTILLAVFGALGISGVLIFALVVGGGAGSEIGPTTVWGTVEENSFRTVLRQAADGDERLLQVTYVQKDDATYESELTEALAQGAGPDLFLMRQDFAVRDAGKVLPIPYESLSASQFQDTFVEAANTFLGETGITAIPLLVDPLVLYWNRDMLASAGYASPPRFWDELPAMALNITQKNEAGQVVKSAVAFGEYQNVNHAKDILATLIFQAGGSVTRRDDSGRLVPALQATGGGSAQATESALRFYTEFADPSKANYSWSRAMPESRAAFAAGDLALYVGFASEKDLIARMNPNLDFAVAATAQVRPSQTSPIVDTVAARVYGLAIARTTKDPQGAFTVASLLAAANVSEALSVVYGIPSARRDVLGSTASGDDELFRRHALIARTWLDPDPNGSNAVFRSMVENVTTGSLRLSEAVARAHQELGAMLNL